MKVRIGVALVLAFALSPLAKADWISPDALNFAVLYTRSGGHNLSITNVTVDGNIGVGCTGVVQDSGPSTIGNLDFAASNVGQFHSTNGSNVYGSRTYNVANVTSDLTSLSTLSSTLGSETGTSIAINGNTTISASGFLR